jgi:hypothetical protein
MAPTSNSALTLNRASFSSLSSRARNASGLLKRGQSCQICQLRHDNVLLILTATLIGNIWINGQAGVV